MKAARAFKDVGEVLIENRLDEMKVEAISKRLQRTDNLAHISFPNMIKDISQFGVDDMDRPTPKPEEIPRGIIMDDPTSKSRWKKTVEVSATQAYHQIMSELNGRRDLNLSFKNGLIEFLNALALTNTEKREPVQVPLEQKKRSGF